MSNKKDQTMVMGISLSGKGVNMVTPSGVNNIYCELSQLVELMEGKRDSVTFTISERNSSYQERLDATEEIEG